MRILHCLIAGGLLACGIPAWAETAPGTLTVSVVVIDRCVVSNAVLTTEVVKCSAVAPPHRVTDQVKPFADTREKVGRTVIF